MDLATILAFAAAFFVFAAKTAIVMTVLRYGGAAYLIWMGIRLWTAVPVVPELQPISGRRGLLTIFATGIALNLGNPKMPLFYVALLPNVVGASLDVGHLGVLTMVILAVEFVVIGGHVLLAGRARTLLRTPRVVRRVNRAAGGVMIGAGVAVVATR